MSERQKILEQAGRIRIYAAGKKWKRQECEADRDRIGKVPGTRAEFIRSFELPKSHGLHPSDGNKRR